MIKIMKKALEGLNKLYIAIAFVGLIIIIISSFLQVFTRFVINNSLPWTEELARYAAIWMTMCGVAVVTRLRTHAAVDALTGRLTGKKANISNLLIDIAMFLTALIIVFKGWQLTSSPTGSQITPALQIRKGYVFFALPFGGVGMLLFIIEDLIKQIKAVLKKDHTAES